MTSPTALRDVFENLYIDTHEPITLPRQCYTSQEFYDFEFEALYTREWVCIGRADHVKQPGDYFTVNIGDDPFIVTRDETGEISVFSAVCRHRGMLIAEGAGSCGRRFMCPYHSWTYDLHGALLGAPDMSKTRGFDGRSIKLAPLRVEVWNGFIFVNYDQDAEPLGPRLTDVDALLANYDIGSLVSLPPQYFEFVSNWKIVAENATECYHCSHLHQGFHDCAIGRDTLPNPIPDSESAVVLSVQTSHRDAALVPPDYRALFPALPGLTDGERHRMTWVTIPPNILFACQPDNVHYLSWIPDGPSKVHLSIGWMYPLSTLDLPDFEPKFQQQLDALRPIVEQDSWACRGVYAGLRSRFAQRGRLSWEEGPLVDFNRWLVKRYAANLGRDS